jgi:hypothetical protein
MVCLNNESDPVTNEIGKARTVYDVSHLCSRSKCCNPNHLHKETKAANSARIKCMRKCIRGCQCNPKCIPVSSLNDDGVVVPCYVHQDDGRCKWFPLREMKKPIRQRSNSVGWFVIVVELLLIKNMVFIGILCKGMPSFLIATQDTPLVLLFFIKAK